MKFINKETKEIVNAKEYALIYAYTHNSNWEELKEEKPKKGKNEDRLTPLEDKPEEGEE